MRYSERDPLDRLVPVPPLLRPYLPLFLLPYEKRDGIENTTIERMIRTATTPQAMLMFLRCFGLSSILI